MAIRSFFGYDDVVMPIGEQIPAGFTTLPPLPFSFKAGAAALRGATYTKDSGWLKCTASTGYSGSTQKVNYLQASLAGLGLTASATAVVTVGLRWIAPAANAGGSQAANWVHPMAFMGSTTVDGTTLPAASVFPIGSIPGFVYGQEYYLEAQWDIAANIVRRRVDGKAIADIALAAGVASLFAAGTTLFVSGTTAVSISANTIDVTFWLKDMYVIEKTNDGTADSFLGPQRVFPITTASLDQATWAATGAADSVTALNMAVTDSASLTTPVVTTDVANPTANVGLSIPTFAGPVNGVVLFATARRKDGASGTLAAQVTSGTDNSSQTNNVLSSTIVPGYKLYLAEKSPSGVRWTRAAIQAAKLKLTAS
jgi:hypothetical protein